MQKEDFNYLITKSGIQKKFSILIKKEHVEFLNNYIEK